jgi:long-chain acyl-CoA synthetase
MDERDWHRHYAPGVPRTLDYGELTLPGALRRSATEFPEATAILFGPARIRYAELLEQVEHLAGGLAALGVQPGQRVAIQLPNLPQVVVAYYAVLSLGAQVVLTNPLYTDDEILHQWNDAECVVAIVADYVWAGRVARLGGQLAVQHWVMTSMVDSLGWIARAIGRRRLSRRDPPLTAPLPERPDVHAWRELLASSPRHPMQVAPDLDEVAVVQYTGGTTGRSKGALLTHRNLAANVQQIDAWMPGIEDGREVFLAALPYFHVFGMTSCMNHPILRACAMAIVPDPRDTAAMVKIIAKHRVTMLALVPAMFHAINHLPGIDRVDLSSVNGCFSGSAPLGRDTLERFEQLTGGRILEGFGLTETSPVTHVNPISGLRKIGSIGIPVSDTDARVVDAENGTSLMPAGEPGELILRGPQVMAGYLHGEQETALALRGGWFYTGDLATCDEDGFFRIVGRKKEMIVTGGYKVFPDEVDDTLTRHPDVLEAATIGVPDERLAETVKSFVVRCPGSELDEAALIAWCREHLAAYKAPREVEFRDSLPRSSVLKVLRRELLAEELERRKLNT